MPKSSNLHVTHRSDGTWPVIREGASRASSVHETQQDAIRTARDMSRREHGEILIHDRQNRIRARDSHGHDPCPPRG